MADAAATESTSAVTYEELAEIERDFDEVDVEIIRRQYHLSKDVYARRKAVIAKIPKFWSHVLEAAPPEIDRYIQPSDSEIFAECLRSIQVERFELADAAAVAAAEGGPDDGVVAAAAGGDPRSISITFEFSENDWFEDRVLEKKFWWRRAEDGWAGLVSEPVRVRWKQGRDPTKGLMEGAIRLWEARRGAGGDMRKRDLAEFDHMARITETWNGENTSFFTWFAFVSSRRWVSEEESAEAIKRETARRQRVRSGEESSSVDLPEDNQLESQVEAHEDGDGLATVIAEDLWPGAIRYFTQAQENAELSDEDFEDDEDEEDMEDDDQPQDGDVDVHKLISGDGTAADADREERPKKKRRT